jgi:hypothetical protein
MRRAILEQGSAAVAAYMRRRQQDAPNIADLIPYIVATELIRELTYGAAAVSSRDIRTVLAALDAVVAVEGGDR